MAAVTELPGMKGGVLRKDLYFEQTGYQPHNGQIKVHYDPHRHRVLSNGRRWGKTLLGGKEVEPHGFREKPTGRGSTRVDHRSELHRLREGIPRHL
jgi:hypothetical protein